MTDEIAGDLETFAGLMEFLRSGDPEESHIAADKLLIHALETLTRHGTTRRAEAVQRLARAYRAVPKWYA